MRFNVASKLLQTQLQAVNKVVNSKNTLSILDNFLFKIEGDRLYITGSDQDNLVTASLEIIDSDGDGTIAVPAKRLLDMLKEVPGQGLTFYVNDDTKEIDIKFLNGQFNFMGVNADEYPRKKEHDADAITFTVPASMILKGLETTIFAASTDTIRPTMTGILLDIHENDITFVSSDTHKLVRYINSEGQPGVVRRFIMPAKPANILRSLLGKDVADVKITADDKSATFEFEGFSLTCLFIKGNYPEYNRVIPQDRPFALTIDRLSLLNAMRRVALFASMASSLVRFNIQMNELLLSSQDLDYATSAEERLQCDYSGNSMVIGFNAVYMIEILSNMKCDTLVLKLTDPSTSGTFVPEAQQEGEDVLMLLMPMQVID